MSIIDIYYANFFLSTQTVSPTLPGFQGIKRCVKYMASPPHKPISYPSNYYDDSNFIMFTWSGNQVEDYTTQNFFNSVKMWIMLDFLTEDGQFFQLFFIL